MEMESSGSHSWNVTIKGYNMASLVEMTKFVINVFIHQIEVLEMKHAV